MRLPVWLKLARGFANSVERPCGVFHPTYLACRRRGLGPCCLVCSSRNRLFGKRLENDFVRFGGTPLAGCSTLRNPPYWQLSPALSGLWTSDKLLVRSGLSLRGNRRLLDLPYWQLSQSGLSMLQNLASVAGVLSTAAAGAVCAWLDTAFSSPPRPVDFSALVAARVRR